MTPARLRPGPGADVVPVRLARAEELGPGHPTPGMRRQEAIDSEGMWSGLVHTDPGAVSGWHHHGDHQTTIYVVRGQLRLEFGPHATQFVLAGPGDFVHVPAGVVHRESNPALEPSTAVIVRAGLGPVVLNVDGPQAGGAPA